MTTWSRLCARAAIYGALVLNVILNVFAVELALSSCNVTCDYVMTLPEIDVMNSSRFLFTLAPLDHVLDAVNVIDANNSSSMVQITQQFGLHALSLSEFTAPVYIQFSLPSVLPMTTVVTGVGCFENYVSSQVLCRYVPPLDLSPTAFRTSVIQVTNAPPTYAIYLQLPYFHASVHQNMQYKAVITENHVFSVNTTAIYCRTPKIWTSSPQLECPLLVTPSTTPADPTLPYEAYIPLSSYSYARGSVASQESLMTLSLVTTDKTPLASLLEYIVNFAQISFDSTDSTLFSLSPPVPSFGPRKLPSPDNSTTYRASFALPPVNLDWRAEIPPTLPVFVRGLLSTESQNAFVSKKPSSAEVSRLTGHTLTHHVTASADVLDERGRVVDGAIVGIMIVAGEQGFYKRDTLQLALNTEVNEDDEFYSDKADCVPMLPQNVTCVLNTDIALSEDGTAIISVHSKAFDRVDELTVSITHLVPTSAAMVMDGETSSPIASLVANVTQLHTNFKAFDNMSVLSMPRAPAYDVINDEYIEDPYSDTSLMSMYTNMTNVLDNQFIFVEVGCLIEQPSLTSNGSPCTREGQRIFSCPYTYDITEALNDAPYSYNIDNLVWHSDIRFRTSPVVLKRKLINDPYLALESFKFDIHSKSSFSFTVATPMATIRQENTTLTAILYTEDAPRLLFPSVDNFVFNMTAPLFSEAYSNYLFFPGTFTPMVARRTATGANNAADDWELDTAAAVELTCFAITPYAVSCTLTEESSAKRGQVSVSLAHEQPSSVPKSLAVTMSIYTDTGIYVCGGYDAVDAAPLADTPKSRVSTAAASAPHRYSTPEADIASAVKHVRTIAANIHAHSRMATAGSLATGDPVTHTENALPPDWSLAYMTTTPNVPVVDLWSAPAAPSSGTFWALSPSVIWLWPVLGAMALASVTYGIWAYRRKNAKTHPDSVELPSVREVEKCVELVDMTLNERSRQQSTDIPTPSSMTTESRPASEKQSPSVPSITVERSLGDAVVEMPCESRDDEFRSTDDSSLMEVESVDFNMDSLRDPRIVPSVMMQPPSEGSRNLSSIESHLISRNDRPSAPHHVPRDLRSSRSAHTDFVEAYSFSAKSSESHYTFSPDPCNSPSPRGALSISPVSFIPRPRSPPRALVRTAPVAAASSVLSERVSFHTWVFANSHHSGEAMADEQRDSTSYNGDFLRGQSFHSIHIPGTPSVYSGHYLTPNSAFESTDSSTLSYIDHTTTHAMPSSESSGPSVAASHAASTCASSARVLHPVKSTPAANADVSKDLTHCLDLRLITDSSVAPKLQTIVSMTMSDDELLIENPASEPRIPPAFVPVNDFLAPAYMLPTVPLEHYAKTAPRPMVVVPPTPFQRKDVEYDPCAEHRLVVVNDTAIRVQPRVPFYKLRYKEPIRRMIADALDVCPRPPLTSASTNPDALVRAEDYKTILDTNDIVLSPPESDADSLSHVSDARTSARYSFSCVSLSSSWRSDIMHVIGHDEPLPANSGYHYMPALPEKLVKPEIIKEHERNDKFPFPPPPPDLRPSAANPLDQARYAAWLGVTGYQLYECEAPAEPKRDALDGIPSQNPLSTLD